MVEMVATTDTDICCRWLVWRVPPLGESWSKVLSVPGPNVTGQWSPPHKIIAQLKFAVAKSCCYWSYFNNIRCDPFFFYDRISWDTWSCIGNGSLQMFRGYQIYLVRHWWYFFCCMNYLRKEPLPLSFWLVNPFCLVNLFVSYLIWHYWILQESVFV